MERFRQLTEAYRWCFENAQGPCTIVCLDPYEWILGEEYGPYLERKYPNNFYVKQ